MEVKPGYKMTEVGVIPEDWRAEQLGSAVTLERGFDLPARLRREGCIPIVSSSGITSNHSEFAVRAPGIVTGRYGTIGKVFFIDEDYWPLNTTLFSRSFHGNDPRFISYLLGTVDFQSHSGKSGVPGVNRNDIHELAVAIPPVHQQRAIAKALGDVDALLSALDRLIAKKRDLKQAAMQQLLTGKTRLPGFSDEWAKSKIGGSGGWTSGGDEVHMEVKPGYKQTEAGIIPEDWEVSTIGEQFEIQLGKMLDAEKNEGALKPYLGNSAVQWNYIGAVDLPMIALSPSDMLKYRLKEGDLLVCEGGEVGRAAIWESPIEECYYQKALHRLRPKKGFEVALMPAMLRAWSESGKLANYVTQTSIAHLPKDKFSLVPMVLPPRSEQREIARVLKEMDSEITALESRRRKTHHLKQGMMQELLTGKTRLVEPETHNA